MSHKHMKISILTFCLKLQTVLTALKCLSLNAKQQTLEKRVKNLHFWNKIGANNATVDTLEIGYKIPFISTLKSAYSQNDRLCIQNSDFAQD